MNQRKLKLGILLDSYDVPAWAYRSLERIADSDYAEFALVILNSSAYVHKSEVGGVWKNRRKLVYQVFRAIDEKLFIREQNAFELKNARGLLSNAPVIEVRPIEKGEGEYFEPADIDRIRVCGLDILIKMGFRNLRGDVLHASKCGIWSYDFGGNPPGFWEVVEGRPETEFALRILGEEPDGGKTLYRSWFSTYPFSPARNRNRATWASCSFLPRQIALLHRLGEERFTAEIERFREDEDISASRPQETPPSNALALRLIARLLIKLVREVLTRKFCPYTWYLMFDFGTNTSMPFRDFKEIIPPQDRFWADPNVIQRDDDYYVFVEEYTHKAKKGHISVIKMDRQGNHSEPVRILDKDYHLSYPFVFAWEDKHYLVPESAENRTIDLYECTEFPDKWQFKMSLMENVQAVDTTLFFHCGKWWLFTGMAENEGAFPEVELFLFFSDDLFTNKWNPHPQNPIVSDVKRARPAGRIFKRDGKIIRPSQDCSKMYGYGFDLNEILILSESEYSEETVASVRPPLDKGILGTHTYVSEGKLRMIDACTKRTKCALGQSD
jgi:hypothetical protein